MLETYRGTLHGDKIVWEADAPKIAEKKNSVAVYVTIVDEVSAANSSNGEKMAKVLGKLAAKGGISSIENASRWQPNKDWNAILSGVKDNNDSRQ